MKIRSILTVGTVFAAAVALTGCTGGAGGGDDSADGEVTFQTWSLKNDTFTPYFEKVIDAFEKDHEGVTVDWVDQPADGYEDKILQQAESGELPDVVNLPPEYAQQLAAAGQLLDLTQETSLDAYGDGGVAAYTYEDLDGTYGFPWYLGTELNYWNMADWKKAGIDTPPETFQEMLDGAAKLADKGIATISDIPGPKSLQTFITDGGAEFPFMVDGKFAFDTPEAEAILERYAELYKKGAVSPEALQNAGTLDANVDNFVKGNAAWSTSAPNFIDKNIAVNAPKLLPDVKVTSGFGTPPLFVQGVGVAANSSDKKAAVEFAQYLTNDENQIEFLKLAAGYFPGTKKANEDPTQFAEAAKNDEQKVANKLAAAQMDTARVQGGDATGYTEQMENYAKQQFALAVKGELTPKEALQKASAYADENVSK